MIESFVELFPEQWRILIKVLLSPVSWIPPTQNALLTFSLYSDYKAWTVLKWIFFLLPSLMFIVAVWCSMLSVYTYPFRRNRNVFISTLFITWWDSLRACWLFWVGSFRFVWLSIGWFLGLVKMIIGLVIEALKQILYYPFLLMGSMSKRYFQAGIPWIAVMLTGLWILLEATIFTYVLTPTVFEVLSDLVGLEKHTLLTPVLFLFLFLLIGGSFACIEGLAEAIQKKDVVQAVQMVVWELFVVMVEVMFLYREFVDAITPWIAQQTGEQVQLGLFGTIGIAFIAWIGIRAMTWFLFARYGTSTLIAIIARKPIHGEAKPAGGPIELSLTWTKSLIENFQKEVGWFHDKGKEFLESLALPALQVIASAINFCMVFITSKPIFSLPFKHIEEVMETNELLKIFEQQRKKIDKEE